VGFFDVVKNRVKQESLKKAQRGKIESLLELPSNAKAMDLN
jgi:hypothetical protein